MIYKMIAAAMCLVSLGAVGCNLFVPLIFLGEHQKRVPAEFDKLSGKRICIVVWAEPETMFDYPHIRLELSSYAAEKIREGVKNCEVIDPALVEDLVQRDAEAAVDPVKVGRHFDVDSVVYAELLEFQMRDPSAPALVKGKLQATVTVYDLRADPDELNRFPLEPIRVSYPQGQPLIMSANNSLAVRQQTYIQFGETLARKFFEYKVNL